MYYTDNIESEIRNLEFMLRHNQNNRHSEALKSDLSYYKMRKEVIDWLKGKTYKYFVTITFRQKLKLREAEDYLNRLLKMVNNDYFPSKKKKKFLNGIVFLEWDKKRKPHFHILFFHHRVFQTKPNKRMENVVKKKCKYIKKISYIKNGLKEEPVIDVDKGIDIQEYYQGGLEKYLTKSLEVNPDDMGFFTFMSSDGLDSRFSCN